MYLKNEGSFYSSQNITDSSSDIEATDLTGDGEMLLVVENDAIIRIYENINETFTLFQTLIVTGNL